MPTVVVPESLASTRSFRASYPERHRRPSSDPTAWGVRRRGSVEQGRALESLGHAVEYLMDSRIFSSETYPAAAHAEAIQILKYASRAVFNDCPVVVPLHQRLSRWLQADFLG